MAIICKTRCFVSNKKGDVKEYTPGIVPGKTQSFLKTLNPIQRVKFEWVRGNGSGDSNVAYTRSEVEELYSLYLANDNMHWVRDTFLSLNPGQRHSVDSVYQTISKIRTLDSHYPNDNRWVTSELLREIGQEMDPERFVA